MKVELNQRGDITDVMVDGKYKGAVVKTEAGYGTVHINDTEAKTFTAWHFACYYVEKN